MRSGREKGGEEGEESKSPSFSLSEQQKGLSLVFFFSLLSLSIEEESADNPLLSL